MFRGPILMWIQRRRSKSIRIKIVQCVMMRRKEARGTREQVLAALIRILAINLLWEVELNVTVTNLLEFLFHFIKARVTSLWPHQGWWRREQSLLQTPEKVSLPCPVLTSVLTSTNLSLLVRSLEILQKVKPSRFNFHLVELRDRGDCGQLPCWATQ